MTRLTDVGTTLFYISQILVFPASKDVATLISWLIIYKCSDTVEEKMILGGINDESPTNIDIHNCYICNTS